MCKQKKGCLSPVRMFSWELKGGFMAWGWHLGAPLDSHDIRGCLIFFCPSKIQEVETSADIIHHILVFDTLICMRLHMGSHHSAYYDSSMLQFFNESIWFRMNFKKNCDGFIPPQQSHANVAAVRYPNVRKKIHVQNLELLPVHTSQCP